MLSDQLKEQTSANHQDLEKILVARMRAMRDMADYADLLSCFYLYFSALEDRVNLFIGSSELPDHLQRRKSDSLLADIKQLGGPIPVKNVNISVPEIHNYLQAFGALYVLEGSTLGGQIICKMLAKQLGVAEKGMTFFQSYGDHLTTMWATFKLTLNRQAQNVDEEEQVIAAANDTFLCFGRALTKN